MPAPMPGVSEVVAEASAPPSAARRRTTNPRQPVAKTPAGRYDSQLLELIDWCLQLDPLARPQSVYALQKALIHRHASADRPENWFSDLGSRLKSFIGRS